MKKHEENILDTFVNRAEGAVRGAVLSSKGKTRVTMFLDNEVLSHFRDAATEQGCGYQTLINSTLSSLIHEQEGKSGAKRAGEIKEVIVNQVIGDLASFDALLKEVEELNARVRHHLHDTGVIQVLTETRSGDIQGRSRKAQRLVYTEKVLDK